MMIVGKMVAVDLHEWDQTVGRQLGFWLSQSVWAKTEPVLGMIAKE